MKDRRRKDNMNVPDSLDTWKLTTSEIDMKTICLIEWNV